MTLSERIAYERTFGLRERFERSKESIAMFVAWHMLPKRVRMWVITRAHADATQGEFSGVEVGSVKAFDLIKRMR